MDTSISKRKHYKGWLISSQLENSSFLDNYFLRSSRDTYNKILLHLRQSFLHKGLIGMESLTNHASDSLVSCLFYFGLDSGYNANQALPESVAFPFLIYSYCLLFKFHINYYALSLLSISVSSTILTFPTAIDFQPFKRNVNSIDLISLSCSAKAMGTISSIWYPPSTKIK